MLAHFLRAVFIRGSLFNVLRESPAPPRGKQVPADNLKSRINRIKIRRTADITGINRKNLFIMKNMPSWRLSARIFIQLRNFSFNSL
ncbi:hypothetical protein A361_26130 [Cytobacillus oceanisediminis 2691]|uniref:Uncharacterized protein n=2 Tax=Cytobacillus oceanisediminis TaxID=665099 RepID=A0A160MI74_9BACI|nr:hypothetical protein A361_26130 [Cytobacillus oceanisediminis 2691]OHX42602.1 hypothetical protein BBV17_27170 [Cytobacillus oceanisediminis]